MEKRVGIVGGGVIGSSIAYYLTQYDAIKTYVFEKAQIGSGTSAKSAGTVCLLDDSLPEAFFDLRVLALRAYMEMEKESQGSAGFKRTGTLVVCPSEDIRRFVLNAIEMSRKNSFILSLAEAFYFLLAKSLMEYGDACMFPEQVELSEPLGPMKPVQSRRNKKLITYVNEASFRKACKWKALPRNFKARKILEQIKLQTWTLKPAVPSLMRA